MGESRNGSPAPVFFTDETRQSFWTEIKIHPEFLKDALPIDTPQVTGQVTGQVTMKVLRFCEEPRKASEIQGLLQLKHRETFQNNYLRPLIQERLIAFTIPDKPQSRLQQYITTEEGKRWLQKNEG